MVSSKPMTTSSTKTTIENVSEHGRAMTVPQALGRLRVALEDAYLRASRQHGLTPQQAGLLCATLRPAPVGALARTLRCDQSNVTRLVDRALKHGLVRRRQDRDDGRVTVIELSPKGRRLAERFIATLEAQLAELLADWPSERQQELVGSLNELSDALDLRRAESTTTRMLKTHTDASTSQRPRQAGIGP
jgi:DNA-binding MarR family transcriptional regulator